MNILFLSFIVPFPTNRGDKRRIFSFLYNLSKNNSITYLSFNDEELSDSDLLDLDEYTVEKHILPIKKSQRYLNMAVNSLSSVPLRVAAYKDNRMHTLFGQLMKQNQYDMIFLTDIRMAPYIPEKLSIPTHIDFVDAYSLYYRRASNFEFNVFKKLVLKNQVNKMKAYEKKVVNKTTICSVSSIEDQTELINGSGSDNVHFIQNTIDFDELKMENRDYRKHTMLFLGYMDHTANIDAVHFFCDKILLRIIDVIPDIEFHIAGANPGKEIQSLADNKNIFVSGYVPDLRKFVSGFEIFICPLRIGAGTRLKILEAMAISVPVISTSIGCNGLNVESDKQIIIGDTPKEFSEGVIRLLTDSELKKKISSQALQFVETEHHISIVGDKLEKLLPDL